MSRFAEDLLFILFVLIVAAILGFLLAWFLRQRRIRQLEGELSRCRQSVRDAEQTVTTSTPAAPSAVPSSPTPVDPAPRATSAVAPASSFDASVAKGIMGKRIKDDDLTLVEGIGPKISGLLKADGCSTWRALSNRTPAQIQVVLDRAGKDYQIHNPATWPQQAQLAADGDWEGLKRMQAGLKGGRA
ncbi:MAG: hypothetical protein AAGA85_10430 [Bacteroidota bacterium]